MNVLYVVRRSGDLVFHGDIIRSLHARGCRVTCLSFRSMEPPISHPELAYLQESYPQLHFGEAIEAPQPGVDDLVTVARKALTCAMLSRSGQSAFFVNRAHWELPWLMRLALHPGPVRRLFARERTVKLLRRLSRHFPPDPKVVSQLRSIRPEVVVASPTNVGGSPEFKYVAAARKLVIPSAIPVLSWDTLTTKEALPVVPDVLLAWNRSQYEEATRLHRIPARHVATCGAFKFDHCFRAHSVLSPRATFCRRLEMPDRARYVAYIGSSPALQIDEVPLVRQLAQQLRAHPDRHLRAVSVVCRPHPQSHEDWRPLGRLPNVRIQSSTDRAAGIPIPTRRVFRDLYDLLFHSVAAIGINTSAFWEAIILDRPCVAIQAAQYHTVQSEVLHFRQLARSGAIAVGDLRHSVEEIRRLIANHDARGACRAQFVRDFVRPHGLDRDASDVAAEVIMETAVKRRKRAGLRASVLPRFSKSFLRRQNVSCPSAACARKGALARTARIVPAEHPRYARIR